jgi:predicted HTH domain antitoxin
MPCNKPENNLNKRLLGAMAVKLFEMKRLSSGMAAALIGTDRVSFLLNLHRYGVAMIDLTEEELLSDLANA